MRAPAPEHVLVAFAWLSIQCGGVHVLSSISPPPLPIQGSRGLSSIVFSIELTVQCDGCLIWGLGRRAGLVAGLRKGQAYGVFHRPGFGFVTPQNVIIAAKCSTNAKCNNINTKYNLSLIHI